MALTSKRCDRSLFVGITSKQRLGVLLALVTLVFGVATFNLAQGEESLVQIWLAFAIYVIVLAQPFIWYRASWGWLHPLIFWVLWTELARHILPRLGLYANGLTFHIVMPGAATAEMNAVVTQALMLTAVGVLSVYMGFSIAGRLSAPRLAFRPPRRLVVKTGLVALVAVLALIMLIDKAGSVSALMLQRGLQEEARIFTDPNARIFKYLIGILKTACLVWFALDRKAWRNPMWLLFFVLGLAIGFMATGSRSGVAIPVLMAGVIWMLHYRRVPYTAIIAGVIFSLVVLGIGGTFRHATRSADSLSDVELDTGLIKGASKGFQGMVQYGTSRDGTYGILASVPDEVGFLWGESYLSMLVAPVPSAVLPFPKPEAGGKLNAVRVIGKHSGAVPPGNIGEAYWNFGILGVPVVMFLFGVVLKWFYRLYVVNDGRGWVIAVYVVTLFSLKPNSSAFYDWIHAMVPIVFFLILFCGSPTRRSKENGAFRVPKLRDLLPPRDVRARRLPCRRTSW